MSDWNLLGTMLTRSADDVALLFHLALLDRSKTDYQLKPDTDLGSRISEEYSSFDLTLLIWSGRALAALQANANTNPQAPNDQNPNTAQTTTVNFSVLSNPAYRSAFEGTTCFVAKLPALLIMTR
jgi:hypothetical protein